MSNLLRYLPILAIAGYFIYVNSGDSGTSYVEDDIDLNRVLDVTIETIYAYDEKTQGRNTDESDPDAAFLEFSQDLQNDYNAASPALYKEPIAVEPRGDASLLAYVETNGNGEFDQDSEEALYLIEVDGENSRVIATSRSGAVGEHRISGTGILTGFLLGSMLSRQRAAGANPANKKTQTAKQAAKSRSGSGSHSKGK